MRTLILLPPLIPCMHSSTAPLLPHPSATAPLPSAPHRSRLGARSVDRGIGHRRPPSPRCSPRCPARQSVPGQTTASAGALAPPRAPACVCINASASIAAHGRALIRERTRPPAAFIFLAWCVRFTDESRPRRRCMCVNPFQPSRDFEGYAACDVGFVVRGGGQTWAASWRHCVGGRS